MRFRAAVQPQKCDADDRRDGAADDEHEAAHGGRALFVVMPAGADLSNGLAEFDLVQKRHHEVTEQPCDDRRNDDCKAIQYNIHTL